MPAPILLLNVGWMTRYQGWSESDPIANGGAYVEEHDAGGEMCNFGPLRGRVYGYVRQNRGGTLNLARVGGTDDDKYIDDVTVVFTATRPEGGRFVVGWYQLARVWRSLQFIKRVGKGNKWSYYVEADEADTVLVEPKQRKFPVPRGSAKQFGFGQCNVRYTDEANSKMFVKALRSYLRNRTAHR